MLQNSTGYLVYEVGREWECLLLLEIREYIEAQDVQKYCVPHQM